MQGYAGDPIYFQGHGYNPNPPQCECHECTQARTQARWQMSIQGQLHGSIGVPYISGWANCDEEIMKSFKGTNK